MSKNTPHHKIQSTVLKASLTSILFSGTLLSALIVSDTWILPRLTNIEIDGTQRSMEEIVRYHATVTDQIADLKYKRHNLITPVHDQLYLDVLAKKKSQRSIAEIETLVSHAASTIVFGTDATIDISHLELQNIGGKTNVQISGVISKAGPRSMTLIAQYIEALRKIKGVSNLNPGSFTRKTTEDGEFYSPFSIRFSLQ